MPKIQKLDHVAIACNNLDEAVDFYTSKLGLTCTKTETLKDRGIRVAFIPIGETCIELIAPLHDKSEVSRFLNSRGPGIHHIALKTGDVDEATKALQKNDVQTTTDAPQAGANQKKVIFVHPKSTGGVLIELVE